MYMADNPLKKPRGSFSVIEIHDRETVLCLCKELVKVFNQYVYTGNNKANLIKQKTHDIIGGELRRFRRPAA